MEYHILHFNTMLDLLTGFRLRKKNILLYVALLRTINSISMTLLTQHSAPEHKSPFQNYLTFLKWTGDLDSLNQRALRAHVTHPYQLLVILLNHPTYF